MYDLHIGTYEKHACYVKMKFLPHVKKLFESWGVGLRRVFISCRGKQEGRFALLLFLLD